MAILPPSTAPSTSILFPDLNKAANNPRHQDKDLVRDIEDFLNREDIQMTKGRDRLFFVCLNFKQLSFEQAYTILNPDAFRDEFEQTRAYRKWLQFLNILRIFLTLLPLIFTWFSLSLATSAYQQYITKHSNETDPFLTLWQNGFSTNQIPNPEWLTAHLNFSLTAGIDVGILCLLLLANFSALLLEYASRRRAKEFAAELQHIASRLLSVISNVGKGSLLDSDEGINKVVKVLKNVMVDIFEEVNEKIEKFDQAVKDFRGDLQDLTREVQTMSTSARDMAQASVSMDHSAHDMAQSTRNLDVQVQQTNSHLHDLNVTEQHLDGNLQTVAGTMQSAAMSMNAAAGTVTGAANKLDAATQHLDDTTQQLDTTTKQLPASIQQITDNASIFAREIRDAAAILNKVANALAKITGIRRKRFFFF